MPLQILDVRLIIPSRRKWKELFEKFNFPAPGRGPGGDLDPISNQFGTNFGPNWAAYGTILYKKCWTNIGPVTIGSDGINWDRISLMNRTFLAGTRGRWAPNRGGYAR